MRLRRVPLPTIGKSEKQRASDNRFAQAKRPSERPSSISTRKDDRQVQRTTQLSDLFEAERAPLGELDECLQLGMNRVKPFRSLLCGMMLCPPLSIAFNVSLSPIRDLDPERHDL